MDIVNDGEFGKSTSWSLYGLKRLSGFELRPINLAKTTRSKKGPTASGSRISTLSSMAEPMAAHGRMSRGAMQSALRRSNTRASTNRIAISTI